MASSESDYANPRRIDYFSVNGRGYLEHQGAVAKKKKDLLGQALKIVGEQQDLTQAKGKGGRRAASYSIFPFLTVLSLLLNRRHFFFLDTDKNEQLGARAHQLSPTVASATPPSTSRGTTGPAFAGFCESLDSF